MPMDRVILHCDCNSYYASVETIDRPELAEVPMAVCGDPKSRRGIILAKNERAKAFGIVTAETVYSALRKCPNLTLVPPHHEKYRLYSERINAIYAQYTDQVEAFSVDESWLDVTGSLHLFGTGVEIADQLRQRVREELGITISVGVSFNKVFAKLGSDYKKPDATTNITRDNFQQILWPLPARDMLFVGEIVAEKLAKHGIRSIGEIAMAGEEALRLLLGKQGEMIWAYANGLEDSPVKHVGEEDPVKSISNGITFTRDILTEADIRTALRMLCDTVGTRLRRQGLYCTTLQVQIKDSLLKTISRQRKLHAPVNTTHELTEIAMQILRAAWRIGAPIRLLAVSAEGLTEENASQISLLQDTERAIRSTKLDDAMDAIRARYGKESLQFGSVLHSDIHGSGNKKGGGKSE